MNCECCLGFFLCNYLFVQVRLQCTLSSSELSRYNLFPVISIMIIGLSLESLFNSVDCIELDVVHESHYFLAGIVSR